MEFIQRLDNLLWQPLFIILIAVGIYLTILLRGIQFRKLGYALKLAFTHKDEEAKGDISHFQALTTALAATVGIGNIAGISTALLLGGLGSLFWLWVTCLIGMATKYSEAILGIRYRKVDQRGQMAGGPMYYMERGLGWKWLAVTFALFGVFTTIATGNLVQSNAISAVVHNYFHVSDWITGTVLMVLTGLVLIGGIRSIGRVTSYLVPMMALFYVLGSLGIIAFNVHELPAALVTIMKSAFTGQAAVGGFAGSTIMMAMQMGVARGVFSNESGLGSSPIAAAAAKTDHPGRQALISMTSSFLSTIVCTFTGLAIAVTHVMGVFGADGKLVNGAPLTALAFDHGIPFGGYIVVLSCFFFGYSTIVGWAYYGERCAEYLLGTTGIYSYRCLFTVSVLLGVFIPLEFVWPLADILNVFMVLPNLIALVFLSRVVKVETNHFLIRVANQRQAA